MEEKIYDWDKIDFISDNLMQRGLEEGIITSDEVYDTLGIYDMELAEDFIRSAREVGIKVIDTCKDKIGVAEVDTESELGILFKELEQYPLLTREEEIALAKRKDEGDESARELLINSNMKLVVSTALKYTGKGVSLEDLIAEGSIGLITACDRYDYNVGKFDTFAFWYIRRNIRFAIARYGKVVSLPVHLYNKLCILKKEIYLFNQEHNRQPTIEEMAKITGENISVIKSLYEYGEEVVELDADIKSSDGNSPSEYKKIKDTIADTEEEYEIVKKNLYEAILRGMDVLSEREKAVLVARYGLEDGNGCIRTLYDVGKEFGLTRERTRQIESCALRKLRHPKNLGELIT